MYYDRKVSTETATTYTILHRSAENGGTASLGGFATAAEARAYLDTDDGRLLTETLAGFGTVEIVSETTTTTRIFETEAVSW